MMRVKAGVCKTGLALCAALLVMIFAVAWLWNTAFSFSPLVQGCLLAAWLCGLLAAWVAAQRSGLLDALVRRCWQLLAVVVLAVACAQFSVGLATRQTLTDDYGSVVNGALLYAQQGRSAAFAQQYQWYLNHWPNNRGIFSCWRFSFGCLRPWALAGSGTPAWCAWAISVLPWPPCAHLRIWAARSAPRRRLLFCRSMRCLRLCIFNPAWHTPIRSLSGLRRRRCFCGSWAAMPGACARALLHGQAVRCALAWGMKSRALWALCWWHCAVRHWCACPGAARWQHWLIVQIAPYINC